MNNIKAKKRTPWLLFLLLLIFIGPIPIAWVYYSQSDKLIDKTTNHGTLIAPPLKLSKLPLTNAQGHPLNQHQLRGKWLFLYVDPNKCGRFCQENLYNMRQIRRATGKNMNRVDRVVLTFKSQPSDLILNELLQAQYKGTLHFVTNKQAFAKLFNKHPSKKLALKQGYLYLVDPLGNIMMSYTPNANPSGILKDLQRLLKVSQVG